MKIKSLAACQLSELSTSVGFGNAGFALLLGLLDQPIGILTLGPKFEGIIEHFPILRLGAVSRHSRPDMRCCGCWC